MKYWQILKQYFFRYLPVLRNMNMFFFKTVLRTTEAKISNVKCYWNTSSLAGVSFCVVTWFFSGNTTCTVGHYNWFHKNIWLSRNEGLRSKPIARDGGDGGEERTSHLLDVEARALTSGNWGGGELELLHRLAPYVAAPTDGWTAGPTKTNPS